MKACVIQPPYSLDLSYSDEYFAKKLCVTNDKHRFSFMPLDFFELVQFCLSEIWQMTSASIYCLGDTINKQASFLFSKKVYTPPLYKTAELG
jgi:hypothetical protein